MACNKTWLRLVKKPVWHLVPTPCGYCAGCRRDKITMWTDRILFEMNTTNLPSAFVTLTYNDEHLPKNRGVSYDDVKNFNKRLRYFLKRPYKFYLSSEYGQLDFRPHYHMCLLGFNPRDVFDVQALHRAWSVKDEQIGFYDLDFLNSSSVRYVMKYVSKEMKGDMKDEYEKRGLPPLFHTMSKGIGKQYFLDHLDSIRKLNGYYVNGKLRPLPKYYADLLKVGSERDKSVLHVSDYQKQYQVISDILGKQINPLFYNQTALADTDNDGALLFNNKRESTILHRELLGV